MRKSRVSTLRTLLRTPSLLRIRALTKHSQDRLFGAGCSRSAALSVRRARWIAHGSLTHTLTISHPSKVGVCFRLCLRRWTAIRATRDCARLLWSKVLTLFRCADVGRWRSATFCRFRYSGAACLDSLLTAHEVVVCVSGLGVVNIVAVVCLLLLGCCCAIDYVFAMKENLFSFCPVWFFVFGWRHAAAVLSCVLWECENVKFVVIGMFVLLCFCFLFWYFNLLLTFVFWQV